MVSKMFDNQHRWPGTLGPEKKRDTEVQYEYLYIEEYPFEPKPIDDECHESEEENHGVIVIDLW
jgi:hypothetical protein